MTWMIFWADDGRGGCASSSENWETVFGFPGEEVLSDGWMRILHPEELERVLAENYRMKLLYKPFAIPMRVRVADGSWVATVDMGMPMVGDRRCYQGVLRPVEPGDVSVPLLQPDNVTPPAAELPFALITMQDAAAHVGLSVDTLYRMVKRGGVTWAHRAKRKWLVDLSALLRALRH